MIDKDAFPIVLIEGRYNGWGTWWAFADLEKNSPGFDVLNDGPHGGDWEASDFYRAPPSWAAYGETPDQAIQALVSKAQSHKPNEGQRDE